MRLRLATIVPATTVLTAAVLTATGIAVTAAAPAAFADTSPSSTHVVTTKIRDGGAAVRTTLSLTCPTGATATLVVTVTAANGTRIAQGTGTVKAVACTGTAQDVAKRVNADPAGALFITGLATSRTARTICDAAGCETTTFDETIRIK